jgi:predicted transcriptional regulator
VTAAQLGKALERSGRTVRGAAKEMGIHERTLHRYLAGEAEIPKLVELVARCWLDHPPVNQGEK